MRYRICDVSSKSGKGCGKDENGRVQGRESGEAPRILNPLQLQLVMILKAGAVASVQYDVADVAVVLYYWN